MRNLLRKYWYLAVVALLCCAPAALPGRRRDGRSQVNGARSQRAPVLSYTSARILVTDQRRIHRPVICDDWANQSLSQYAI